MTLQKYLVLILVSLLVMQSLEASVLQRITTTESPKFTTNPTTEICQKSTPCGWAVYVRFTRVIDYFMKNNCECPEGKRCIRTDDDISVAAYVYRCKELSTEEPSNNS